MAALKFGLVSERADRVLIVACGPSLQRHHVGELKRLSRTVHVIAINGAIQVINFASSFFTLDPDKRVMSYLRQRLPSVTYYAAVPDDYGTSEARVTYHRISPISGVTYLRRLSGSGPLKSRYGLSDDPRIIHTGNSGWGALGVAYLMRASKIAFVGLDATAEPYGIINGFPNGKLNHVPDLFASALPQIHKHKIQVMNGSPKSRVTAFPRCEPIEAVRWLIG